MLGPGQRPQRLLVDAATGAWQTVVELAGFARGLAFAGRYAFVGLSKIRETSAMDGVPLADRRTELKCGVAAVDLRRGQIMAILEFQTAIEEIFDVQLLPGLGFPEVVGFQMINPSTGEFMTEFGPLASAEVILLDEINRIPLKSQSAFLEGLQDRTVTVGKTTYDLPTFNFGRS